MTANFPPQPILAVDDEERFLQSLRFLLRSDGLTNLETCSDSRRVPGLLAERDWSVLLLDMSMPYLSGWELLPRIRSERPWLPVVIITAVSEVDTAVECMKTGAFDYLVKPVDHGRLVTTLRRAVEWRDVQNENLSLKKHLLSNDLENPEAFSDIVTAGDPMLGVLRYIEAVAGSNRPVLITGETGVGKELVARAVHRASGRSGEFVAVNVSGLDDHLFSDSLFGHIKGAFTGAHVARRGLIERAAGGTLLLDEIGDLSQESQVKLLRLLQEGTYYPVGSDALRRSAARIVAATNQPLEETVAAGRFRQDLYYRFLDHHVHLPPLRKRPEDITLLAQFFLEKAARTLERKTPTAPRELEDLLLAYHFPGNVRELEGLIFDAVSTHAGGVMSLVGIRQKIAARSANGHLSEAAHPGPGPGPGPGIIFTDRLPTLKAAEAALIEEALRRASNNQTTAAAMLGLTRQALVYRLGKRSRYSPAAPGSKE